MLGIDNSRNTTRFLSLCNGMYGQSRFTGRLRSINLDDTASRITSYSQRRIQSDGTSGYHSDFLYRVISQFHNSTSAITLFYLVHGRL